MCFGNHERKGNHWLWIEVTKGTDLLSLIRVFGIDPYTAILDAGQICVQEKHEQETGFERTGW